MGLRPAINSTDDPPAPSMTLEQREYIQALRRRIEVQEDQLRTLSEELLRYREQARETGFLMQALREQLHYERQQADRLALDLAVLEGRAGPGWQAGGGQRLTPVAKAAPWAVRQEGGQAGQGEVQP